MNPSKQPLLTASAIQTRVAELAGEINRDFGGTRLVLLVVLKGAVLFASDLMRHLECCHTVEFIRARSYAGSSSTGRVDLTTATGPLTGRDVLVIEDILDTGRTLSHILEYVREQCPARLGLCTLLDKPARRHVPVAADYVGFTIDDQFVVGYGLDYNEEFRGLPAVHVLTEFTE